MASVTNIDYYDDDVQEAVKITIERGDIMKTLASKFMESQNHSIYRAYHTAVEIDGIHKITSPNGDISLNWIGELIRLKD